MLNYFVEFGVFSAWIDWELLGCEEGRVQKQGH